MNKCLLIPGRELKTMTEQSKDASKSNVVNPRVCRVYKERVRGYLQQQKCLQTAAAWKPIPPQVVARKNYNLELTAQGRMHTVYSSDSCPPPLGQAQSLQPSLFSICHLMLTASAIPGATRNQGSLTPRIHQNPNILTLTED